LRDKQPAAKRTQGKTAAAITGMRVAKNSAFPADSEAYAACRRSPGLNRL